MAMARNGLGVGRGEEWRRHVGIPGEYGHRREPSPSTLSTCAPGRTCVNGGDLSICDAGPAFPPLNRNAQAVTATTEAD